MKIGIAGNYGHLNLGDEALLLGAVKCATEFANIPAKNVVVLSDMAADTLERLKGTGCEVRQLRRPYGGRLVRLPIVVIDIFRALKGLDWLVFGGGGLLNDSNRTAVPMFALIRILAWCRGVRVAWWSVGLGPLDPGLRYRISSWLLSSSNFASVRDNFSKVMSKDMIGRDVTESPDLAHALEFVPGPKERGQTKIAVSVIPYMKDGLWFAQDDVRYADYCNKMIEAIRGFMDIRTDIYVQLFPISLRQDNGAIDDIMRLGSFYDDHRVGVYKSQSVEALLNELSSATLVIATRLHSLVLATIAAVPAVTVAYQPKVACYSEELAAGLPLFKIEDFSSAEIIEAARNTITRSEKLSEKLADESTQRRTKLKATIAKWQEMT